MTYRNSFLFAALVTIILLHAGPAFAATTQPVKLRIGVYDSRAVAVAYSRSGADANFVADLKKQRDDAKAKGDDNLIRQIESQGQNRQMLRHLQAFSNAPVDDILATVKEKLPTIAGQAGVDVIVARADYQSPDVQAVDVTDAIVALFKPDTKTSAIIADLRKREPYPMLQILGMKD